MLLANFRVARLSEQYQFDSFNCNDRDLNDFLLSNSKAYQQQLLAVTYLLNDAKHTVAFWSIFNDKVAVSDVPSQSWWNRKFKKRMPIGKQMRSYPAVKIGRLGVDSNYQNNGLGGEIIQFLKRDFIENNKTGCKYITVDAYKQSIPFYQKHGFEFLSDKDEQADTRTMYFDLASLLTVRE